MATTQNLCPECETPVPNVPVQISGGSNWVQCPTCSTYLTPDQLKRKSHLTTWMGGGGEEDLNEAQTRSLIEEYLKFSTFYRWDQYWAYGVSNTAPFFGLRNINNVTKYRGLGLFLDTTTTVNGVWEAGLAFNTIVPIDQGLDGHSGTWSPFYFSMRVNRSNPLGAASGEKLQGIGWGDPFGVATPWATNYVTATNNATVQLRFNYTSEKWEVLTYVLDGNPPDVVDCDYQPAFSVDISMAELAIDWDGSSFKFYINRVLAKTVSDSRGVGLNGTVNGVGPYFFWTNGSGAASQASEAGFYQGHIFQPLALPGSPRTT